MTTSEKLEKSEIDITKQRSLLNWAQIITLCASLIAATWVVSKIHSRFEVLEAENTSLKQKIAEDRLVDQGRIEYVNARIDKKFNQLKEVYHND